TLMLCVDISASGLFGSQNQSKQDLIIEICAVLAFSAIKNSDKVGLVLFSDQIEKVIPPKKGRTHVLRLIRELLATEAEGKGTDIGGALTYINRLLDRKAIVVMASDFQDQNFDKSLKITNRKHDLVNILIYDKLEEKLPDLGLIPLNDTETGQEIIIDSSNQKVRNEFYQQQRKRRELLKNKFLRSKIDFVELKTNESYVRPLITFFKQRMHRY